MVSPARSGAAPVTGAFLDKLADERRAFALPPQLPQLAERVAGGVLELLFPHFTSEVGCRYGEVADDYEALRQLLTEAVRVPGLSALQRAAAVERFFAELPALRAALLLDAHAIDDGDPAAGNVDEVILAYPGFYAIAIHRVAHEFYGAGVALFPRLLAELAHRATGIDIHPGARIGASFAIDHGTGIVIGESAVLGARVRLYQGVTLGAANVKKGLAHVKRHPTVGDDVVIYANATILGGETHIGDGSRIGGNVWLAHSVPPGSVVTATMRVDERGTGDDLLEFNI